MLTRLKVSGFKNLIDVDLRFGPFTCVAGANGTGKSNLFDAIQFLSRLAGDTLLNAALAIRSEGGRTADVRNLFHRIGDHYASQMTFEAEMIVPFTGIDDLGQRAEASITLLCYQLVLAYRADSSLPSLGSLEILHEELTHINVTEAASHLRFPHKPVWRRSVVKGRRIGEFISTVEKEGKCIIKLHQEGTSGRPREYLAATLPRTVLSSVNAIESPTALLTRREMQSWRLLPHYASLTNTRPFRAWALMARTCRPPWTTCGERLTTGVCLAVTAESHPCWMNWLPVCRNSSSTSKRFILSGKPARAPRGRLDRRFFASARIACV